jgi:hypothetical protein
VSEQQWPPALVAAADQAAAAYADAIVNLPKTQASVTAELSADAVAHLAALQRTLPASSSLVGGPLDGVEVTLAPGQDCPLALFVRVGPVEHVYSRVVCDWWTVYEWARDIAVRP